MPSERPEQRLPEGQDWRPFGDAAGVEVEGTEGPVAVPPQHANPLPPPAPPPAESGGYWQDEAFSDGPPRQPVPPIQALPAQTPSVQPPSMPPVQPVVDERNAVPPAQPPISHALPMREVLNRQLEAGVEKPERSRGEGVERGTAQAPPAPRLPGEPFERPPTYRRPHPKGGVPKGLPRSPIAVPDIVLDGADLGGLTVRAASLRGDDHRYYGEPRQDSVALWPLVLAGANTVLACVADGVGSQPNSHLGSDLVCSSLRDQIEREAETWTWDGFGGLASGILERVAAKMACYAEEHRLPPKTLSSTLVAAVVAVDPVDGRRRFVVMRLGDSTAFLLQGGKLSEFGSPKTAGGQVVDSVTEALPGDPRAVIMAQGELSRGDVLILCSDGLSDPMGNGEVKEQLIKWWSDEEVPGILEFGWQLGFRAKSFGDDRSAVCIWGR